MADNLGIDFALVDGDIVLSNNGDIQTVSNDDNVEQAVKNALFTEKGTLYYDQNYGFGIGTLMGEKNILAKRVLVRNEIITVLSREPRIESVEQVIVLQNEDNPSRLDVSFQVTLINGEQLIAENLVYPFVQPVIETSTIENESQRSNGIINVMTQYPIYNVRGVWLANDVNKTGTNYYTGGSISKNKITLGTNLPTTYSDVIVDYDTISAEYETIKVTQIEEERQQPVSSTTICVDYSIYDISEIYNETDDEKLINLADGATFQNQLITLSQEVETTDYFLISYSTNEL